ncbi:MotA/TolQ/ExbB proton channel family protein [Vibrio algarum]|uniref:MotA/TolQ/ExbB proton channel family protein n=1 Tax=Vibrio algarum TaxID=3020714 RepID=A0ABT4YW67_9VIBR|nr:MotA/TolQ/ExbB proton channel family protein [Vibrio sp. KJ40-1]MDB1125710.1 MotA/TolQ/ExbB proton channel family protein [Vibrio sp. KJ40-1]
MKIEMNKGRMTVLSMLLVLSSHVQADLLKTTKQVREQQQIENRAREHAFQADEQALLKLRDQLVFKRQKLDLNIAKLTEQFSDNEQLLAQTEEKLHLESGSLGELFGVARQVAKEFQSSHEDTVSAIGEEEFIANAEFIAAAKTLPSKSHLYALWEAFNRQLAIGSSVTMLDVSYVKPDGIVINKPVLRIGSFGLIDENGYLDWSGERRGAKSYDVQPPNPPPMGVTMSHQKLATLDPSGGKLLEQLSLTPTLQERVKQAGVIGKVILVLLSIGLLIGLTQGIFLLISRLKINAQLKDKENIGSNALGRVLGVYKYDQSPNVEALELRLYETILDEQQKLERGLSMLKLLAALSPMLGLLGTVTGMIETFQVITQFGNADPKMMASGISTALITTVLGLTAAMPMLFMHNVLSTQAENVRTLLEKQGVGLVAQRAEQDVRIS